MISGFLAVHESWCGRGALRAARFCLGLYEEVDGRRYNNEVMLCWKHGAMRLKAYGRAFKVVAEMQRRGTLDALDREVQETGNCSPARAKDILSDTGWTDLTQREPEKLLEQV